MPRKLQYPVVERRVIGNQICHPYGLDIEGLRGGIDAATGTHELGLGNIKEIIEEPVESRSVLPGLLEYKSFHGMAFLVGLFELFF